MAGYADHVSDLRDRRNTQTRADIVAAAIALFTAKGFDSVSMEEVAAAAGVSRRTAYRHFATKEDIVFHPVGDWFEILQATVDDRGDDECTRDLLRRALHAIATHIESDPQPVLDAFAVVAASQPLMDRQGKTNADWIAFYAALIMADIGEEPDDVLAATVAGAALIGATTALFPVWSSAAGRSSLTEMTTVVLDQIDSVWPDACR